MRLTQIIVLLAGTVVISAFPQKYVSGQAARIFGNVTSYQQIYADGVRALQEIYDTPIPTQIRQTFDRTILDCGACSDCAFTVLDGGERVSIFTKKFIIVGLEPDGFGDIVATLMFEGARHPFLLRMDNVGGGRPELRNMTELPEPLGEGFVHQLRNPAYRRYWL